MRAFISWSGARSEALARALKDWLPTVLPRIDTFHSAEIPKGQNWHSALIAALRGCRVGVFCVTPESLRSEWMLFEAGALAQHGDAPALFTYLYGVSGDRVSGPLGHFQATHFDREDTRRFVRDLAAVDGDQSHVAEHFDERWDAFEAAVLSRIILPIQRLVPEFQELFEDKMTFHESFPDCSNKRWDDRLRRAARVHERLSRPHVKEIVESDPYLHGAFDELLSALDRYDMHIGASLMQLREYASLDEGDRRQLEDARTRILDLVSALERQRRPPVFQESLTFESEPSTEKRKAQIHQLGLRLGRVSSDRLLTARDSLDWGLDRIAFYTAYGAGLLPNVELSELVSALKREEEQARTRSLVRALQPLYYAIECIDERLVPTVDPAVASRLSELLESVDRFVEADTGRDSGGHIRRRITSIRRKLQD